MNSDLHRDLGEICELEPHIKMALIMAICYWPSRTEANAYAISKPSTKAAISHWLLASSKVY